MKEKLTNMLGGFGVVLYYILSTAVAVLPFVMIDAPFWLTFIFFVVEQFLPFSSIVFWIWGLVRAITGIQDIWAIAYYILFAIMFVPFFISVTTAFFSKNR